MPAFKFEVNCLSSCLLVRFQAEKTLQDLEAVLKIDEDIKKAQCALFWVDVEAHEANLEVCARGCWAGTLLGRFTSC